MPEFARYAVTAGLLSAAALACTSATFVESAGAVARATRATGYPVDYLHWVDGRPEVGTATATSAAGAEKLVARLAAEPDVSSVQSRTAYELSATSVARSDPYLGYATHLQTIDARAAWERTTGKGVSVAVLDTGVDPTAPDLTGRVVTGANFATGTDIDTHGTEVATVIAGAFGNTYGAAGVAPDVDVLSVRVCAPAGCRSDAVARGIIYAADAGADVINLSLGGDENAVTADAVAYALGKGCVVVASAGNSGDTGNATEYPASYPGVLSVSAAALDGTAAAWAEHNSDVDLTAPGEEIPAGQPAAQNYAYVAASGTSFSAPQVSAAAALVRSVAPSATPAQVGTWLTSTASPRSSWPAGYGTGMLDVAAAVQAATVMTPAPATPTIERRYRRVNPAPLF